jgi:hypothetical protein
MTDNVVARSRMGDLEDKVGIDRLDVLQAERRKLVCRVADLRARYGSFGTFEHLRGICLATVKMKARASAVSNGIKVTEDGLKDIAHASSEYVDFITQATLDRSELTTAEIGITEIEETIRRGNSLAYAAGREMGL